MPPVRRAKQKPTSIPRVKPPKDSKKSHLYTDDNPSTTLHGTGFKSAQSAHDTIALVSRRSLTYQWQVINTMYHRAKSHPSMRKPGSNTSDMRAAMDVFRTWLDETYPTAKDEQRRQGLEFKPLLGKDVVGRYGERIEVLETDGGEDEGDGFKAFTRMYVGLAKGKRLANTLVDDAHPEREDWEIRRERALVELVGQREGEGEDGLWNDNGGVSEWHLRCVAWAWSPVGERRLPP